MAAAFAFAADFGVDGFLLSQCAALFAKCVFESRDLLAAFSCVRQAGKSFAGFGKLCGERFDFLRGDVTLKLSIKNLTDSKRAIVYDPVETSSKVAEREYKVGRDVSLSLTYEY